ncbi:MAG: hypothetical protein HFH94_00125 [Lachnospiraceae bacterium]|nr:hypothetical protein [uncultured Acetatifactor sp.]MCI9218143.1 hypothetical protein [Lachnospiraceae bacterium]
MPKLLNVLSDKRKKSVRAIMAEKDAEIAKLRSKARKLYIENDDLIRENRELRIRNGEVEVAYSSLKEILRRRGVPTT